MRNTLLYLRYLLFCLILRVGVWNSHNTEQFASATWACDSRLDLEFKDLQVEVNASFFDGLPVPPGEAEQTSWALSMKIYEGEKFSILNANTERNKE